MGATSPASENDDSSTASEGAPEKEHHENDMHIPSANERTNSVHPKFSMAVRSCMETEEKISEVLSRIPASHLFYRVVIS